MNKVLTAILDLDGKEVPCKADAALTYLMDPQDNPDRVLIWESNLMGWGRDWVPGVRPTDQMIRGAAIAIKSADRAKCGKKHPQGKDGRSLLLSGTHFPPDKSKKETLGVLVEAMRQLIAKECPDHPHVIVAHGDKDQPHCVGFLSRHSPVSGKMYHPGPVWLSVLQSFEWSTTISPGRRQDGVEIARQDGVTLTPTEWHQTKKANGARQLEEKDRMLERLYKVGKKQKAMGINPRELFEFRKTKAGRVISIQYTEGKKAAKGGKPRKYNWRLESLIRAPMSFVRDLLADLGLHEWAERASKYQANKAAEEFAMRPLLPQDTPPTY